jgi:hypothetical protein
VRASLRACIRKDLDHDAGRIRGAFYLGLNVNV